MRTTLLAIAQLTNFICNSKIKHASGRRTLTPNLCSEANIKQAGQHYKAIQIKWNNLAIVSTLIGLFVIAGCASDTPHREPTPLTNFTPRIMVKPVWSANIGSSDSYALEPISIGNHIIAASVNGQITQIDSETGKIQWKVKVDEEISSGLGANDSIIVVTTTKGNVLAFTSAGKALWQQNINGQALAAPFITEKLVLVRTLDNRIYAFDATNGKQRWLYQRTPSPLVLRAPLGMVASENALVAGFPGGKLGLINLENGAILWEGSLALGKGASEIERLVDITGRPAVRDRYVCAAAYQGRIGCFDLATGGLAWSTEFSGTTGVVMDHQAIYAIDSKSIVSGFDMQTGKLLWSNKQLQWRDLGVPKLIGSALVVGDAKGEIYFVSTLDGSLLANLKTDGSSITVAPIISGHNLVVQTKDGRLYAFSQPE